MLVEFQHHITDYYLLLTRTIEAQFTNSTESHSHQTYRLQERQIWALLNASRKSIRAL